MMGTDQSQQHNTMGEYWESLGMSLNPEPVYTLPAKKAPKLPIDERLAIWRANVGETFYQKMASTHPEAKALLKAFKELAKKTMCEIWMHDDNMSIYFYKQMAKEPDSVQFLVSVAIDRKIMTAKKICEEFGALPIKESNYLKKPASNINESYWKRLLNFKALFRKRTVNEEVSIQLRPTQEQLKRNDMERKLIDAELKLINDETKKLAVMAALRKDGLAYQYIQNDLKDDIDVVLAAVNQDGYTLDYVSWKIQAYKEVVFAALNENGLALVCALVELRSDREIVLVAVNQNGLALELAAAELRHDREIVFAAVKQNGLALQFVAAELRNDKEIAKEAVKQNGLALQFAADEIRNDKEIAQTAVKQNDLAFQYVSATLQKDKEFLAIYHKLGIEKLQIKLQKATTTDEYNELYKKIEALSDNKQVETAPSKPRTFRTHSIFNSSISMRNANHQTSKVSQSEIKDDKLSYSLVN